MDGIITADRKITPKSMEMKKVYEPVEFHFEDGNLRILFRLHFERICATLIITYKEQGEVVGVETFDLNANPYESVSFAVKEKRTL